MGAITHPFVSAVADGGDASLVQPSNWNADHTLTGIAQTDTINTFALTQTFTLAPVFTDQPGTRTALGLGTLATQNGTFSGTSSGTNTGDQTSIVGISGTKAQFDTACSDDNFAYVGTANAFTAGQTVTPAANTSALTVASHTHTTNAPALDIAQTWNAAGVTFTGLKANFTSTASAAGSLLMDLQVGGVSKASVSKDGKWSTPINGVVAYAVEVSGQPSIGMGRNSTIGGLNFWGGVATPSDTNGDILIGTNITKLPSTGVFGWSGSNVTQAFATTALQAAANSIQYAGDETAAGAKVSRTELNKKVTAIANASATAALTITIPNAAHSGQLYIEVCGSLGAGGAIGANEATATNCYTITFTRTVGVNAVAAISAASGATAVAVAGAATVTCTAALSAVSGAVGVANTFTVNVTISRSAGSSANHTCLVYAKLMNSNATGVTIA